MMNRVEKGYYVKIGWFSSYAEDDFLENGIIITGVSNSGSTIGINNLTGEPYAIAPSECEEARIKDYIDLLGFHSDNNILPDQPIKYYRKELARCIDKGLL